MQNESAFRAFQAKFGCVVVGNAQLIS